MTDSELKRLLDLDSTTIPPGQFNRLIHSRSPYLLQHADNPTDWREWGEEAFAEAERRDLPLFVSIGYATCHWCHVMAHESFADPEVAEIINRRFVAIKVDREERPDIDEFYMAACQALTGSGGWPLNVFILPDRRPFFCFNYLPKNPMDGVSGLKELLVSVSRAWREHRDRVDRNCDSIMQALESRSGIVGGGSIPIGGLADAAFTRLGQMFDSRHAGFGTAPKFPMPTYLLFLLSRTSGAASEAVAMAHRTLLAMARGGINDQLSGGFHRYSVDERWLVPHFEKMLYDQALLIMAYAEGYRLTADTTLLDTARSIASFVMSELALPEGGFCGALDADSEGEEGSFYLWSSDELDSALGELAGIAGPFWGVSRDGNFDGKNILHRAVGADPCTAGIGMTMDELGRTMEQARQRLLAVRSRRERPLLDLKVITSWNGLMIAALCRLAAASGDDQWLTAASRCAEFIYSRLYEPSGRLGRNWLRTPAKIPGFADDYAYYCWGLTELAQAADDRKWLERAGNLSRDMLRLFIRSDGRLAISGSDADRLPLDLPSCHDGVLPSTAGVAASVLGRLGGALNDTSLTAAARNLIAAYRGETERVPVACLALLMAEEELQRAGN